MASLPTEFHFPLTITIKMMPPLKVECKMTPAAGGLDLLFGASPAPNFDRFQSAMSELSQWYGKYFDIVESVDADVVVSDAPH